MSKKSKGRNYYYLNNVEQKSYSQRKNPNRRRRSFIMSALFSIFLFIRYYVDLLLDKCFGFFMDGKKQVIEKPANPIVLESAFSLARKIRKGELTSEEVVQAFIERIKQVNPILNSIVDNRFEEALKEAKKIDKDIATGQILDVDFQEKVFLGVPFTSKESTACKGLSWTFGLKKREGKKASFDADCVELLKKAGAICLGVSNIPQLNLWQETSNPVYGITNNPYNTTRNVGGSSGGESSILAACGSPLGIGFHSIRYVQGGGANIVAESEVAYYENPKKTSGDSCCVVGCDYAQGDTPAMKYCFPVIRRQWIKSRKTHKASTNEKV